RVGIFGLVSERKAQLVAAEAVASVVKRGIPVKLLIAGDAFGSSVPYGDKLRARIAEPDLAGHVEWLPFQSDVASLYRRIDLNLLISTEEGFGRTIIEAAALGVPSVGTRTGGIPELILDGRTGWLVNQGDVDGLAKAIEAAAMDRAERIHRGEAARLRTQQHFTIQAHVENMMAVWNEVIEVAARRRA
ncbi:glycosyltransferase, partial [bacterium]|nr:glycosyltransferase [bacterium]